MSLNNLADAIAIEIPEIQPAHHHTTNTPSGGRPTRNYRLLWKRCSPTVPETVRLKKYIILETSKLS